MKKNFVSIVCFMVIVGITTLANAGETGFLKNENAKVYTVFFSISPDLSTKILSDLESKCEGIDFIGKEIISYDGMSTTLKRVQGVMTVADEDPMHWAEYKKNELVLQSIENSKKNLDGLILFFGGFCDRRYLLSELPTIVVDCSPFRSNQIGFKNAVALAERYGTKSISATYGVDVPEYVSAVRLNDLVQKVKLFEVINKMKNSKIISVQNHDGINRIDQGTYDAPISDYDLNYPKRLKENFGAELIILRFKELMNEMEKFNEKEAEKIADMWINEAKKVEDVKYHDIVRAAKLYLGHKELLKKYDADAITMNSADTSRALKAVPPLTVMELSKEHIPSCCQSHIDCQVTQLIGLYLTEGRIGFVGDFLNDWAFTPTGDRPENVMIVAHCGAPINPHGNDRIPYMIRSHWVRLHFEYFPTGDIPTATTVEWPSGEAASIIKFDVYRKKVSVYTGTVLDGNSLYENFPNCICRNKIVVEIDDPENCHMLPSNPQGGTFRQCDNWDSEHRHWGGHHVMFYGNHRKNIKNFAALIGFEVIDRDSAK